ncbi:lipolytic protein G-D-S-L family [Cordyceps militaris CM01]|uniref:Lipolytic protein G-D-S-L family n=1 Tax=Cordyceps militaris (strain CM01) TaxID=983644 RepID=G3JNW6_CORMM|nr:lipolytic protein G-D-S-L family [Cordyceps militaris CM01]EGX89576.1 lipolytic protein G-D-S-L family [Cordyceps militaris CM01]
MRLRWAGMAAVLPTSLALPAPAPDTSIVLHFKGTPAGNQIENGRELRILPVGDSITVGYGSDEGGDGDGYRRKLRDDLSGNKVIFAGTETTGTMEDGYFAAWSGKTIQFISDHVEPSLDQRPNVVLLAAGTNDMNPNPSISTEGNDPVQAALRLGRLVDKIITKYPGAVLLVAVITDTCDPAQAPGTRQFQKLVPRVVQQRRDAGHRVLAVDFTSFVRDNGKEVLRDCIHPTNSGYWLMGDYWYDFLTQVPGGWIQPPVGGDPQRPALDDPGLNGGIERHVPPPDFGQSPVDSRPEGRYKDVRDWAVAGPAKCGSKPAWRATGKIAHGLGRNGDWKFHKNWTQVDDIAAGFGLDGAHVRLHDMNGDDYVWIDPNTGEIRCWLNNLPKPWSPAGTNNSIIGSGAGRGETVYLADMNGDGMDDYLIVNPRNGAVRVFWNHGPDSRWANGWKFVDGGVIAAGVPHANLATLRFPDINGDGRADYVYIGQGGSLVHWLNVGSVGGTDVVWHSQRGIATGVGLEDLSRLVFADINGDGRDDYLVYDDDGGISGFLNQRTNREGVPLFIDQGGARSIMDGFGHAPSTLRLADMDGDGKDDYVFIGDNGSLSVWYNRGTIDDSMAIDGLRFADITGSQGKDYVWVDPKSGAPIVYSNNGDSWSPVNNGHAIAAGAAPGNQVVFGDIDGYSPFCDGYDDYLVLDPETGALTAHLLVPGGGGESQYGGYMFKPVGQIASGLGPGKNVRIADIDGDGRDDYIYLSSTGKTTIYRNMYGPDTGPHNRYSALPEADALGIGQRPEEISFHDINGQVSSPPLPTAFAFHPLTEIFFFCSDGKADYVWTRPLDGQVEVWLNMYPQQPAWRHVGVVKDGVGTSGANVRFAALTGTRKHRGSGRADYVVADPSSGAFAAWLNGCDDRA